MANLDKHHSGGWRIRFTVGDKRSEFYPGKKLTKTQVRDICNHIAKLERSVDAGVDVDASTVKWIRSLSEKDLQKLKKKGLIVSDETFSPKKVWTLKEFYDAWTKDGLGPPSTERKWNTIYNHLVAMGLDEKLLADITEYDGDLYVKFLEKRELSLFTIRRNSGFAKKLFGEAVKMRILAKNPFAHLKTTAPKPNEDRKVYVPLDASKAILDACPDWEWRLIFGLMRWSGIRCPSELKIKISEVLWDKSKMLIHSPKTAHHEGRESRWIPIFQEVAPLLEEAIDHARDGAVYVLGSRRNSPHTTLARQYGNILRLAGVAPYGKPFVNLRSSRETDLANAGVPWHLIQMWMGHSEKVSRDHYMQVLDGNFTHWSSVVPKETEVVPQLVPQTVAANQ